MSSVHEWVGTGAAFVGGAGGIWATIIATQALHTWKAKIRIEREVAYMDQLVDSVHELINCLGPAMQMIQFIRIGIDAYENSIQTKDANTPHKIPAYIKNSGKDDADSLGKQLAQCKEPLIRVQSLLAKGQVLGIDNFDACRNACGAIVWTHDEMQKVWVLISRSWYWPNPEVQRVLMNLEEVNADTYRKTVAEGNVRFLEFVKGNYSLLLDRKQEENKRGWFNRFRHRILLRS